MFAGCSSGLPSRMRKPMLAQSSVLDGGGGKEGIVSDGRLVEDGRVMLIDLGGGEVGR